MNDKNYINDLRSLSDSELIQQKIDNPESAGTNRKIDLILDERKDIANRRFLKRTYFWNVVLVLATVLAALSTAYIALKSFPLSSSQVENSQMQESKAPQQ